MSRGVVERPGGLRVVSANERFVTVEKIGAGGKIAWPRVSASTGEMRRVSPVIEAEQARIGNEQPRD